MFISKQLFALLLLIPACCFSQEEKITTDQPDQSDGATVVDKKAFQLESSLYFNTFKGMGHAVVSSSLVRYGISKKIEARLLVEQGYHRDLYITEAAHATAPLAIGAKAELLDEKRIGPAVSLLASLQVPATNFKSEPVIWAPALVIIMEKHISDFTITLNGGAKQESFEPVWEWQSTGDVKYEINNRVEVFGEYFGQFEAHEPPLHNIDGGVLYAISNTCQVHLTGGTSLFHQPGNYFINTGMAFNLSKAK
jgi:hypothetical protein